MTTILRAVLLCSAIFSSTIFAQAGTNHISGKTPPILLVHGTADPVVPIRHSERLYDALVTAKVPAKMIRVEGAGHSFGQISSVPEVMSAVMTFFDQNLKTK